MQSNTKGQVVIPKKIRELLGIKPSSFLHIIQRGRGLYLYPITDLSRTGSIKGENLYSRILEKTKGAWSSTKDDEPEATRHARELKASAIRKKLW